MRILLLGLALLWAMAASPAPAEATPSTVEGSSAALLTLADEVLRQVSELRGLAALGGIERQVHDEATLRAYISGRLREEYPGDKLQREQRLLTALGLLPAGCDLEKAVGDLYAAQTLGYYDPERRTLYLSESLPAEMQRPTLAHELTHALQDQHFKLGRFLKPEAGAAAEGNDDARMAAMSLVEGDATAVMLASLASPGAGGDWAAAMPLFEAGIVEQLAQARSPSAPPFLLQLLNFPYRYGTPFVASLYSAGGWRAVDGAFARPPGSSEQVLHPGRYSPPADEPVPVGRAVFPEKLGGLERHYDLVLGEYVSRLVIETELDAERAESAAAGWDGDRATLYVGPTGDLVAWLSVWDSSEDAAEFAEALRAGKGGGRLIEKRAERIVHLRASGALEPADLLDLATSVWLGWR